MQAQLLDRQDTDLRLNEISVNTYIGIALQMSGFYNSDTFFALVDSNPVSMANRVDDLEAIGAEIHSYLHQNYLGVVGYSNEKLMALSKFLSYKFLGIEDSLHKKFSTEELRGIIDHLMSLSSNFKFFPN